MSLNAWHTLLLLVGDMHPSTTLTSVSNWKCAIKQEWKNYRLPFDEKHTNVWSHRAFISLISKFFRFQTYFCNLLQSLCWTATVFKCQTWPHLSVFSESSGKSCSLLHSPHGASRPHCLETKQMSQHSVQAKDHQPPHKTRDISGVSHCLAIFRLLTISSRCKLSPDPVEPVSLTLTINLKGIHPLYLFPADFMFTSMICWSQEN